ncbi:hypothetical protein B0H13DRAFT_1880887 [Mycena leptocephala]|nr:hypothetical protein B0H13DRAFT_1880887 [Mycena leptocephala]
MSASRLPLANPDIDWPEYSLPQHPQLGPTWIQYYSMTWSQAPSVGPNVDPLLFYDVLSNIDQHNIMSPGTLSWVHRGFNIIPWPSLKNGLTMILPPQALSVGPNMDLIFFYAVLSSQLKGDALSVGPAMDPIFFYDVLSSQPKVVLNIVLANRL